uniref:Uncharacterized protein n=1 Tax=Amphimedon queenslandica TaxID=400682 RepID=A0A1X7SKG4_AMPQE
LESLLNLMIQLIVVYHRGIDQSRIMVGQRSSQGRLKDLLETRRRESHLQRLPVTSVIARGI